MLAGAGLLLAALAPFVLTRVPQGSVGATRHALLPAGWHLTAPARRVRVVPLAGRVESVDLTHTTGEGASIQVTLSLDYRLDPDRLAPQASVLAEGGLPAAIAHLARRALRSFPASALLPGRREARAPLPAAGQDAIRSALRDAGIEAASLSASVGPAGSADPGASETLALTRQDTGVRLVLIGLDGADWRIIDPLMRQGRLPRLRDLVERGTRASLRSYDPMISPLLWTTMATGVGPDVHGVADFQAIDPKSGRRVPITSRFRKVKALWNILGEAGAKSAFVAWWASYPAEAVEGWQVSNLVAFETVRPRPPDKPLPAGLAWPPDYLPGLSGRLITAADLRFEEVRPLLKISRAEFEAAREEVLHPPASEVGGEGRKAVQRPVPLALSILTGSRNYAAIASDLAARRPDLMAVYFEGIDMMGHRFQHCMPPRMPICPEADAQRYADAVTGFYAMQDRLIGTILDAAGEEATVMVVSDHGFRSGSARPADVLPYTTQQPVEWHDPEGILILSGPGARRGARLEERPTLFDIAPTILHLLGLPAAESMPGRVVVTALDPAFAARHPPRMIPTYEGHADAPARPAAESDPSATQAEAELLDSLRALGYIGGDEGAVPSGPDAGSTTASARSASPAAGSSTAAVAETQVFYHRNLATYFLKRKDYERAVEQLRLANERQKMPKTYQMLSEAYLGLGRRAEALQALRESLDTLPSADAEPVLWLVQIQAEGAEGREAAAADARRYAARTSGKPGLDQAIGGLLAESRGEKEAATERYRASFAQDPLRVLVAQRLYALTPPGSRAALLLPPLKAAVAKDPRLDEYQNLIGALLSDSGRLADALAAFRRAAEIDPDNARYAANLGAAYARLERWPEAAEAYERAAILAPSPATSLKLGSVYRRLRRFDRALAAFEQARDLGDASPAPILGIALAQSELNRLPQALDTLKEGLARHPGDAGLSRLQRELSHQAGLGG
jgi:tetratricopeptide (TPR) repeat protein/predicted AlkP superfamily pyrophosphatase or phosphodiesterase